MKMTNPECKLCGDDCSPSLNNRSWCIYCEKGYLIGKKEVLNDDIIYSEEFENYCRNTKMKQDDIKFAIDMRKILAELKQRHLSTFEKQKEAD